MHVVTTCFIRLRRTLVLRPEKVLLITISSDFEVDIILPRASNTCARATRQPGSTSLHPLSAVALLFQASPVKCKAFAHKRYGELMGSQ